MFGAATIYTKNCRLSLVNVYLKLPLYLSFLMTSSLSNVLLLRMTSKSVV